MRKKIVAGNWKMNLTKAEAMRLNEVFERNEANLDKVDVVLFSPAVFLDCLSGMNNKNVHLGAQNFYPEKSGAFTGETSINHLKDLNIDYVLVGHSERRMLFGETHEFLKQKVDAALNQGFRIFFCCGEPENIRDSELQNEYVERQLRESLLHLNAAQLANVVIAYEPVWAIGTGKTATNEQANTMHKFLRDLIQQTHGTDVSEKIQILYGGSCNASNAQSLFAQSDIDGGLIGGASLKEDDFKFIIKAAQ